MIYLIAAYLLIGFVLHWAGDVGKRVQNKPKLPWYYVFWTMLVWPIPVVLLCMSKMWFWRGLGYLGYAFLVAILFVCFVIMFQGLVQMQ